MKTQLLGKKSFSHIEVTLGPGEEVHAESGAMASMDPQLDLSARFRGGFFAALARRLFGGESLFISEFSNSSSEPQKLILTKPSPGEIVEHNLAFGEILYVQPGAFVACEPLVGFKTSFAGFKSWILREGLFRLKFEGPGKVWYGAYGGEEEKVIQGEYLVDTGHLLSYPPGIKVKLQFSGGAFSTLFGGEGLVARLEGQGKVKIQTRSLGGTSGWLNSRFRA